MTTQALCRVCWLEYAVGTYQAHTRGPNHKHAVEARKRKRGDKLNPTTGRYERTTYCPTPCTLLVGHTGLHLDTDGREWGAA